MLSRMLENQQTILNLLRRFLAKGGTDGNLDGAEEVEDILKEPCSSLDEFTSLNERMEDNSFRSTLVKSLSLIEFKMPV